MSWVAEIEQRGQDGLSMSLTANQYFFLSRVLPDLYSGSTSWAEGEGLRVLKVPGKPEPHYTITILKDKT